MGLLSLWVSVQCKTRNDAAIFFPVTMPKPICQCALLEMEFLCSFIFVFTHSVQNLGKLTQEV